MFSFGLGQYLVGSWIWAEISGMLKKTQLKILASPECVCVCVCVCVSVCLSVCLCLQANHLMLLG